MEKVTPILTKSLARELGIEDTIDLVQFRRGIEVELEHAATIHKFAPTADALEFAASVAWDHLRENENYYIIHDKVGL